MVNLGAFIKNLQAKGYTLGYIKSYLARYGVRAETIDRLVNEMEGRRSFKWTHVALTAATVGAVVAGCWFMLSPPSGPEKPLDVTRETVASMFTTNELFPSNTVIRRLDTNRASDGLSPYLLFTNRSAAKAPGEAEPPEMEGLRRFPRGDRSLSNSPSRF